MTSENMRLIIEGLILIVVTFFGYQKFIMKKFVEKSAPAGGGELRAICGDRFSRLFKTSDESSKDIHDLKSDIKSKLMSIDVKVAESLTEIEHLKKGSDVLFQKFDKFIDKIDVKFDKNQAAQNDLQKQLNDTGKTLTLLQIEINKLKNNK